MAQRGSLRCATGMLPGYHPQASIDAAAEAIGASPIGVASKGLVATGEVLTGEVADLTPLADLPRVSTRLPQPFPSKP